MREEYIHDLALIAVKANVDSNIPAYRSNDGQEKLINDIATYYLQAKNQLKDILAKQID